MDPSVRSMNEDPKILFKRPIDITEDLSTSITFYCDFVCENLTQSMINHSLALLRQYHPYFRLHTDKVNDTIWLVEEESGSIPLVWFEGILDNWEEEVNRLANQSFDHNTSLTFLQCHYNNRGRYQLFGVVNHIALDGLGFMRALHTLFSYLGEISQCETYSTILPREQRSFIDVFARNPIDKAPCFNFNHNYLTPQEMDADTDEIQSVVSSSSGQTIGLFKKFDQLTTTKLVTNAKAHSTTVQGVLSIAALITSIWIRKSRPQLPIWSLNWCATNLRQSARPPIDPEDCIQASAPLAWEQNIEPHSSLWSLAEDASKQLHKHNHQHMGWHFLNAKKFNVPVQPASLMTSSNGTAQLQTKYHRLSINDLRIMTAHYNSTPLDASSHMNYTCIYDGCLNLVTTFTYPGLSKQWGRRFHNGVIYLLECFANDENLNVYSIIDILDKKDKDLHSSSIISIILSKLSRIIASATKLALIPCSMVLSSFFFYMIFQKNSI
ncbi:unnamed protein product [Adineta ricciae]|uniref:Phthiocerol/phthiodiolone dimycocerosyl transferase C-terminal domain-containing protein n=1 Tax=Adineta ricciae TaxID=249248 RepID=A0A815E884_ADIRI|nr:unnamed protein product [Adineta ricciae]CAF1454747.1 unnamed protein product [Adineta ricciae]